MAALDPGIVDAVLTAVQVVDRGILITSAGLQHVHVLSVACRC